MQALRSTDSAFTCSAQAEAFTIRLGDRTILRHTADRPAFFVGVGRLTMEMYRGNFKVGDYIEERIALRHWTMEGRRLLLSRYSTDVSQVALDIEEEESGAMQLRFDALREIGRFWVRIAADPGERVWGCGEQFSYLDLRGRRFPLWTSEPGVGRDKATEITWRADVTGGAGGDYYHTGYPQPTFLSEGRYFLHADTSRYAVFDFREPEFHELEFTEAPERIVLEAAPDLVSLVERVSARFGRQPELPDWATGGVILGLKRGEAHAREKLDQALAAGMPVTGLWCEDWAGVRQTSFGTRLFWNWEWEPRRYPGLREWVAELRERGIRFLAYANPNLCTDGGLFAEAEALGHLVREADGRTSIIDFGEFDCGTVDLTKPEAAAWLRDRILTRNMLDLGLSGWMADFGEYLPTHVTLANGADGWQEHNRWPERWAAVNAEAVARAGLTGDVVFFMRAGFTGVQAHCPLLWGGDQSVDFSRHDGMPTTIIAALSSGLMGNAFHHTDIGGYTSLFGNVRTPELMMRWAEMAAFTPVMRTHESNRPEANHQWFDSAETTAHLVRMARVHVALAPYLRALVAEGARRGLPVQRPLFLHFEADGAAWDIDDQYLFGADVLVAPVLEAGASRRRVYLPEGARWVHLWSDGVEEGGCWLEVACPFGEPPVFWREGSDWAEVFRKAAQAGG
jgi:alpha-glucosidase